MRNRSGQAKKDPKLRLLILAVILIFPAVFIYRAYKTALWDGSSRFTLVLNSNPITVFSIDPGSRQARIFSIPDNAVLNVPFGYGDYPASSIYRLGLLDRKKSAGEILVKSVENTFGIVIDGFVTLKAAENTSSFAFPLERTTLDKTKSAYFTFPGAAISIFSITGMLRQVDTNMNFVDLFRLWNAIRALRTDQIAILDLRDSQIFTEDKQPDGNVLLVVNVDLSDAFITDKFQDQAVRSEDISIEVINAAGQGGLAGNFGRILTNLGGNVIIKTTAEKTVRDKCKIFYTKDIIGQSRIVRKLKSNFGCLPEKNGKLESLSDLQVILGTDFVK